MKRADTDLGKNGKVQNGTHLYQQEVEWKIGGRKCFLGGRILDPWTSPLK